MEKAILNSNKNNNSKVILVTGANKGIGYGIIKALLERNAQNNSIYPIYKVILTSRDEKRGMESLDKILKDMKNEKENLVYRQLDITKEESIESCINWLKMNYNQIDILVNNAGVSNKDANFTIDSVNTVFETNITGTINFTEQMLDSNLIAENGEIIFLGSIMGTLAMLPSNTSLTQGILDSNLTKEKLLQISENFKNLVKNNTISEDGWYAFPYRISKLIINSYPRVLQQRKDIIERNLGVYSCHPGWVKTDMGGSEAPLTVEEGIETPLFLIDLDDGIIPEYQGKYFDKCKVAEL